MAKYEAFVVGSIEAVMEHLHTDIMDAGATMNLVDECFETVGASKVAVKVYDKYFMRNGNRASLSVTAVESDGKVFVSAIGAGGGQGILFNFSLGAEGEMVDVVAESLRRFAK